MKLFQSDNEVSVASHSELRYWWKPQIPMKSFIVSVASLIEARLVPEWEGQGHETD